MRMKKLLATAITMAALPLAAQAQAACQDDERLYAMADFADAQRNGTAEPLRLTADTYLHLTPKAREVIGDNLRLLDANCNAMQVVDGEPPVKIEMPFPILYNAFEDAVLRGDDQTTGILLRSFQAKSMDSASFLGLFTLVTRDETLVKNIASGAGISPHNGIGKRCEEPTPYLNFADLFVRFGGQVEGYNDKAWFASGPNAEIISVEDELTHSFPRLLNDCHVSKESVLTVAKSAGSIVIDMGNVSWGYRGGDMVREAYTSWLEAGAPEDAKPQSLFD